mmetsp:Transcript_1393/g.2329  ORF Transcript_1393/g.2329 Transcript_1393/m.2329 type:complete len:95 (+) Transcript_1393:110-394(+)
MEVALPIWGDTEEGFWRDHLPPPTSIEFGGSEKRQHPHAGACGCREASSWTTEMKVRLNSVPGGSTVLLKLVKETPGEMWNLIYKVGVAEAVWR